MNAGFKLLAGKGHKLLASDIDNIKRNHFRPGKT